MVMAATAAAIAIAVWACGGNERSSEGAEPKEVVDWDVDVYRVAEVDDPRLRSLASLVPGDGRLFGVADTMAVNRELESYAGSLGNRGLSFCWVEYDDTTQCDLVFYETEPLMSERVAVGDVSNLSGYNDNVLARFSFSNSGKWERITVNNRGGRLAIAINGRIENAPFVNSPIRTGACTVVLPRHRASRYIPLTGNESLVY